MTKRSDAGNAGLLVENLVVLLCMWAFLYLSWAFYSVCFASGNFNTFFFLGQSPYIHSFAKYEEYRIWIEISMIIFLKFSCVT